MNKRKNTPDKKAHVPDEAPMCWGERMKQYGRKTGPNSEYPSFIVPGLQHMNVRVWCYFGDYGWRWYSNRSAKLRMNAQTAATDAHRQLRRIADELNVYIRAQAQDRAKEIEESRRKK